MSARRGTTLVELVVALLVGVLALMLAFNGILLMVRGERSTDREASKALVDARLVQTLLQDLRSSARSIEGKAGGPFTISRWVLDRDRMVERKVTWTMASKTRLQRQMEGEPPEIFDYTGVLDPTSLALSLRITRVVGAVMRFPDGAAR